MSFRNTNTFTNDKIKIEDSHLSAQLLTSSKFLNEADNSEQILRKISSIIVNLHEGYLAKCRNIQIYRDLSEEEQNLLMTVDKSAPIHTALAGILAIDSCVKCIDKEENFIIANMIRGTNALVSQFKLMQKQVSQGSPHSTDYCSKLGDCIKYVLLQMYCLPAARGREEEQQKQINLLDKCEMESQQQGKHKEEYEKMLGELYRQNDLLKVSLREKQTYITMLENRYERGLPRFQKLEEKKTSHSLAFRMSTEKSSENQSNSASVQQLYDEIAGLKEELLQKNNIVIKMNEEFASEMQKYNSVFKRLEDENRILKRYSDIDTAYLLEELEYQIELLREEKRKDQMVISEIQRKIQGISNTRSSRINTRHGYQYNRPQYPQHQEMPTFEHRPPFQNRYAKFYSPNYATKLSPFNRGNHLKEEAYGQETYRSNAIHPQETYRSNHPHPQETYRSNVAHQQQAYRGAPHHEGLRVQGNLGRKMRMGENLIRKSRNRINHSKQSKELIQARSTPQINLFERVMSKRM